MSLPMYVCDTTVNAVILGYTDVEAAAIVILDDYMRRLCGGRVTKVKQADVLLASRSQPRIARAWIPD